ncbi:IS1182 family transposase [Elizabethkingia argenteiflava]|uniref:IS1182 family transposase n=1 Tax=Elizabethkingia argenteiflava TaxID=2681556 RepID=UPI001BB31534|nr:IS1182 family transposase [Elizabethkingia argenteiflava]
MKVQFKALPSNSPSLFPEDIFDRIPLNHPVRLVNQVVDQLDIEHLISQYKGGGTTSFHPRMLLKVLFYAYLSNIYSCRKIERALQENIHFMWLSGNSTPDYLTINYFRAKRLKGQIQDLFASIVRMLHELEYVSLHVQYVDGTKIESVAGRYTFVWKKSIQKNKLKLEANIAAVLSAIDAQITEDQSSLGNQEISKAIDSAELKARIKAINTKLRSGSKSTGKQLKKLEEDYLPRLEKYEQQLEILGDRNSYSKTDTDAVFMRMKEDLMKNGQLKPAYNTQISTEEQFITHYSIHQTTADTTTLPRHLEGFESHYGRQSALIVADAGYGSEQNYELMERKGITAFVKYNYFHMEQKRKHSQDPFSVQNLYYNQQEDFYVCPAGQKFSFIGHATRVSANGYTTQVSCYQAQRCECCPMRGQWHKAQVSRLIEVNHRLTELRAKARERLLSEQGLYHRSKRPVEVEAAFGQMKSNNKFTRFSMKGLEKVAVEFGLMAIAHNLRKWARKWKNKALIGNPDGKSSLPAINIGLERVKSTIYRLAA